MKVFLTGATGFIGSHLLPRLIEASHEVQALVRPDSAEKISHELRAENTLTLIEGDLLDPQALRPMHPDTDAVIHLVGIIREIPSRGITFERMHVEATRNVVDAARDRGVGRFLHMSALGSRLHAASNYHRTKYAAEYYVRSSRVPFVIFRPSLVFGPGDGFINQQKKFVRLPLPVVGSKTLFQPVAVENVVEGFVKSLTEDKVLGHVYEVGGADRLSLDEINVTIAEALDIEPRRNLHLPHGVMQPLIGIFQHLPFFPVTKDQWIMLGEDNICETRDFYDDFGIEPKPFNVAALKTYI